MPCRSFLQGIVISCLVAVFIFNASVSAKNIGVRIVGGHVISIEETPYLVLLRNPSGDPICGGALVKPQHVVTAAHCVRSSSVNAVLVVGGISKKSEKAVEYAVEKITIHPDYDPKTMHSDVAVLKLAQPMSGDNIKTINLRDRPVKEGDMIQVSGWGQTAGDENMSEDLRTVRIPVASQEACHTVFHKFVAKNMFCASGLEPKGFCMGDSGGPGVSEGKLAGVVSFLSKCGTVGEYSVFTDVYATRSFILPALEE